MFLANSEWRIRKNLQFNNAKRGGHRCIKEASVKEEKLRNAEDGVKVATGCIYQTSVSYEFEKYRKYLQEACWVIERLD